MAEKRTNCVSVRFSDDELELIDSVRGKRTRAYTIRVLALGKLPRPIPEINQLAWRDLGRALGNLSTISASMRAGGCGDFGQIRGLVNDLRMRLIAANDTLNETDKEGRM